MTPLKPQKFSATLLNCADWKIPLQQWALLDLNQ